MSVGEKMLFRICGNGRLAILALIGGAAFLATPAANATLIQTYSFSDSNSVSDTASGGTTSQTFTYASPGFNQFDSSLGVLTSVRVTVTSTRTQTTVLTGSSSSTSNRSNNGSNGASSKITAPGIQSGSSQPSNISQSGSCGKGGSLSACPVTVGPTNSTTNKSYNISNSSFGSYEGSGTVSVKLTSTLSAHDTKSGSWTSTGDQYTMAWSGTVGLEYSYDQHSDASFNSASTNADVLTLDFGSVVKGSSPAAQLFDIYNLLKSDLNADVRLGLNYDAANSSSSGDVGKFSFNSPFSIISALTAGSPDSFSVNFDTSQLGSYSAIYNLAFVDNFDVGCFGTVGTNTLTLKIIGNVIEETNHNPPPVPEPGTLALLGGGVLLLGGLRRRLRRKKA
jgi:hypothetical protein